MKKQKKKRNAPPPPTPTPLPPVENATIDKKVLVRMLLLNGVLLIGLYFLAANTIFPYISVLYLALGALLAVGYLIYNRGFAYRGVTAEQLSDRLSEEEKHALLADVRRRDAQSKWVLTLLLPIVVALLLDTFYLYVLSDALEAFQ